MSAAELIVYACPVGDLADQIAGFMAESRRRFGPNAAHGYMPHCTLTGFFGDEPAALPIYVAALAQALDEARPSQPQPALTIDSILFRPDFHGLLLSSPWLQALIQAFVRRADSPTRPAPLRPKDWLHLSLAYEFPPEQADPLRRLAQESIDVTAPVGWELRFYQRHPDRSWSCQASWSI